MGFTHFDDTGNSRIVDISEKSENAPQPQRVYSNEDETIEKIKNKDFKGDVLY